MKIAVISDVHSNLPALEKVLEAASGMKIVCLGDLVGYNPFPNEVTELLRDKGIPSIMGNHDLAVLTGDTKGFNPIASWAAEWTIDALTEENMDYLSELPVSYDNEFYAVHGSPNKPLKEYVFPDHPPKILSSFFDRTTKSVIALGHTHIPYQIDLDEKIIFNPGSVGQPRDMDPRASYAIFDTDSRSVEINRLDYEIDEVSKAIKEAGLPGLLADRLHLGW